ncbi:MAG: hypothetical protein RhofKO_21020 [Rhodothermales bacterium]
MKRLALLLVLLALPASALAQVGIALRGGTNGAGGDLTFGLNNKLHLRANIGVLPYSTTGAYNEEEVGLDYTADINVFTASGIVDFYPTGTLFRLSAGVTYNATEIDATARANESYTAGNRTFSPDQLGSLTANMDYDAKIQPYLGVGFGNPLREGKTVGFVFDVGMFYTDAPSFVMTGEGMLAPTAESGPAIETALSGIKLYPTVSLGISFAFGT